MNIKSLQSGETLVVVGVKELHAVNWRSVVDDVSRRFEAHNTRYIEVDLSEARFMDSYGLGSLIALNRIAQKREGNLRVLNPSPLVRSILDRTRMHYLIAIEDQKTKQADLPVPTSRSCTSP